MESKSTSIEYAVDVGDDEGKTRQVVINVEEGGVANINIDVRNYSYAYPEWFNQDAVVTILKSVRG